MHNELENLCMDCEHGYHEVSGNYDCSCACHQNNTLTLSHFSIDSSDDLPYTEMAGQILKTE